MKVTLVRHWRRLWIGYEWYAELYDKEDDMWDGAGVGYAFTRKRARRHAWRQLVEFLNGDTDG